MNQSDSALSPISPRRYGVLLFAASFIGMPSCAPAQPPSLPDPNTDMGLGDVVMMTWTTRESDGLLGHVLEPIDGLSVDPHRKVIIGKPHLAETDQTLRVVVSLGHSASVGGGYGPVGAEVNGARATHVAYEVRITGYYEYPVDELRYGPSSGCCVGGNVSSTCGNAYVSRLIRGTGKAQHLVELSAGASVNAVQVVKAEGGTQFRKLSESHFSETYFAYELAPMETLCSRLSAEEEMEVERIEAPKNCFITRIDNEGVRKSSSYALPSRELCEKLATRKCKSEAEDSLTCEARFATEGGSEALTLSPSETAP